MVLRSSTVKYALKMKGSRFPKKLSKSLSTLGVWKVCADLAPGALQSSLQSQPNVNWFLASTHPVYVIPGTFGPFPVTTMTILPSHFAIFGVFTVTLKKALGNVVYK